MSTTHPSLPPAEVVRRGEELYNRLLRTRLEADHKGQIAAIDVDSGDYEVGATVLEASDRLRLRRPDAEVFLLRIGDRALYRIGSRMKRGSV